MQSHFFDVFTGDPLLPPSEFVPEIQRIVMEEYGGNLEAFLFDLYFGSEIEDAIEYLASLEESRMAVLAGMQEWWKAVLESDWEKERKFVLRMLKAEEAEKGGAFMQSIVAS